MKKIIVEGRTKEVDFLMRALPQAGFNVKAVKKQKSIAKMNDSEFEKEWSKAMPASDFKREMAKAIRKYGKKCKL